MATKPNYLVIGGAHGIGLATVSRLWGDQGANVTIADLHVPIQRHPGVSFVETDATNEDDLVRAFRYASENGELDGVVYSAGKQRVRGIPLIDESFLLDIFYTNTFGAILTTKIASAFVKKDGSVVLVSSVAGVTDGGPGLGVYSASKGAVISFARHAAKELAPLRVNCVSPGWTDTGFNDPVITYIGGSEPHDELVETSVPLQRQAYPEEIAAGIIYLLRSTYTTGTNLVIDGGLSI